MRRASPTELVYCEGCSVRRAFSCALFIDRYVRYLGLPHVHIFIVRAYQYVGFPLVHFLIVRDVQYIGLPLLHFSFIMRDV